MTTPRYGDRNTITYFRTPTGWIADFTEHASASTMIQLFSTAQVPLPFAADAWESDVVLALQQSYPDAILKFKPTGRILPWPKGDL